MQHIATISQQDTDQWDWAIERSNPQNLNFEPITVATGTVIGITDVHTATDEFRQQVKLDYPTLLDGRSYHKTVNAYGTEARLIWDC